VGDVRRYRSCLRIDFDFECGYCLAREVELAPADPFGGFEIDHLRPSSRFKNFQYAYRNLVWACRLCNRTKGDTWPSKTDEGSGIRFLDPLEDAPGEHVGLRGEKVEIINGSPSGQFFVDALRLNSPAQRERRKKRAKLSLALRTAENALKDLAAKHPAAAVAAGELQKNIQELRLQVCGSRPWDAPNSCSCSIGISRE
jgi:hypothetical protein